MAQGVKGIARLPEVWHTRMEAEEAVSACQFYISGSEGPSPKCGLAIPCPIHSDILCTQCKKNHADSLNEESLAFWCNECRHKSSKVSEAIKELNQLSGLELYDKLEKAGFIK